MSTSCSTPRAAFKPLLLALAAALPVCAQADVNVAASAQITGLTYSLIDLNTNDGIAPTITFNNVVNTSANHQNTYGDGGYASAYDQTAPFNGLLAETGVNTTLTAESASATSQGYTASASVSTNEALAHIDPAQRYYQPFAVRSDAGIGVNPGLYDDLGQPQSITLSANTALIITGVANVKGQFDRDAFTTQIASMPGLLTSYIAPTSIVGADVSLSLISESYEFNEFGNSIVSNVYGSMATLSNGWDENNFDYTRLLSVQFSNLTDADTKVILSIQANAHANLEGNLDFTDLNADLFPPITPSVPEPGTYLMLGLGLIGIGLARKRAHKAG